MAVTFLFYLILFFHSATNLARFPSSSDRFPAGPRALLGWLQSGKKDVHGLHLQEPRWSSGQGCDALN